MRFRVLGSGSSGNVTLVEGGGARVLVDAGLGVRELVERLADCEIDPTGLDLVLLSHEHQDHARGAISLSRKWGVPLAATAGTAAALGLADAEIPPVAELRPGEALEVGGLTVRPLRVPHDAADPVAFVLAADGRSLGHATDLGHLTRGLVHAFHGCHALLVESNYDPALLQKGPYPWTLKERIRGMRGHLANEDVARLLSRGLGVVCETVVLAHLSRTNNHPEIAEAMADRALSGRRDVGVELCAPEGTDWVEVASARGDRPPAPAQLRLF